MIKVLNVLGAVSKGGIEKLLENLYEYIDSSVIESDIAYHGFIKGYKGDECLNSFKKYKVPSYYTLNAFQYRNWWKNFIKEHHYDIVHVHYLDSCFLYLDLFKKTGAKAVIHSHNTRCSHPDIGIYISELNSFWARFKADYGFACSKEAGVYKFGKKFALSGKMKVLPNGCDLKIFNYNEKRREDARRKLGVYRNFVIGHIGRFVYQKNHEFLIDVFSEVHRINKNAVLFLIGDGEEKKNILIKVQEKKLSSSVYFLGLRDDVADLMNAMDVFVFPSRFEGLGNVLVEAQATGLKIISSDAIQDEADVHAGLLKKLSLNLSAKEWANEIIDSRTENRKNGAIAVKKAGFDIEDVAKDLQEFYVRISK